MAAHLRASLALGVGRPVVYTCTNVPPPTGAWLPIWVRCASQVTLAALLWPLVAGAPAVAVAHCGPPCRSGLRDRVVALLAMGRSLPGDGAPHRCPPGGAVRPEFMAEVCQDCRGLPWS